MSAVRHLRVIDDNGEIVQNDDPAEKVRALESALVRAERTITGLRAKSASERINYARRDVIEAIFGDWQAKTNHKRSKLTDDRFDAIKGFVEKEYTRADFDLVICALAAFPFERYGRRFADGKKEERKDDIGWVCEKARRFELLANLGHELKKAA